MEKKEDERDISTENPAGENGVENLKKEMAVIKGQLSAVWEPMFFGVPPPICVRQVLCLDQSN